MGVQEMITTLSTCTIRPSRPTPPQHMFLPSTDFVYRWTPDNRVILFYDLLQPAAGHFSLDSVVEHLKSSLAVALVHFFPFAGRLFEQPGDGRLALDCNDAGVPFIEACIDLPFSTLKHDGFKHRPFFHHLAPHADVLMWTGPDLPLLSIQVTRFPRDEGFVLGLAHSHVVADGSSTWHFMKSWGECARGVPLSMYPLHMREELRPEKLILPPAAPSPQDEKADPTLPHPPQEEKADPLSPLSVHGELVQCDFHFTSEMVSKLKFMATQFASYGGHGSISSLQALGAHVWRHVMAAKDVDKSKESVFYVIANMRSRLAPPLPDGYFGNVVYRVEAKATKGELEQESLGATAKRIQEVIKERLDDRAMRVAYGFVEAMPLSKLLAVRNMDTQLNRVTLYVSNSPRFPVYEVDFGWGPPASVRYPRITGDGGMSWFPGRDGGGSIDVALALPKSVMDRLEQDEGLLSF